MIDLTETGFLARIATWATAGALRPLDLALTRFIRQQGPETDAAVLLAVALASERNGHGHVCLDLKAALDHPDELLTSPRDDGEAPDVDAHADLKAMLGGFDLADWLIRLRRSPAVSDRLTGGDDDGVSPLVLGGTDTQPLLYLRRYWQYETRIVAGIEARLRQSFVLPEADLRAQLDALFAPGEDHSGWQRIACALAARSAFAIVTGGPGTGKTTTVVRLLALLQGLAIAGGQPPLRIRLAAPTGKAAARLNESIADRIASLPLDGPHGEQVRSQIPTEVATLHRLLGARPDSRHFRHHAGHPLPVDLVVVDEASMVDVEMMASLLEALRPDARLILLGDKDQLASVEAGAVLGDLCRRARAAHYLPTTRDWLQRATGASVPDIFIDSAGGALDQSIAMLRKSYRFKPEGGIGALAALVNEDLPGHQAVNRLDAVLQLFARQRQAAPDDLGRIAAIHLRDTQDPAFAALVKNGYRGYLTCMRDRDPGHVADQTTLDQWARDILKAQGQFQLLAALRQGPWGVEGLNRQIVAILSRAKLLDLRPDPEQSGFERHWFAGRPVLVTRNDYSLGLMNGDIGITLAVPVRQRDGQMRRVLRVAFPAGDGSGGIRWILPSRLQSVDTVFAMTVHKSQGSEFTHAALILPDTPNPVLTRELIYTGITRARQAFTLVYRESSVLGEALERRVRRASGICLTSPAA
ncbi:exodeoxyribonuclease V subunit alpha [Thiobaca trueperi]|uniref:RecBCD enzyme subunit RecD n=1 Tax=Thiobaca trueperi TaxID=127458 RepID=A0A4R3MU64_9GAMM|nr:exodeoxyribonuclease V subunit alpha [Thiobaca trueperi]TCT19277.1 DNA helicase/exodeoxyribonuclease V alpha subunit [Thiobaca trueperi]